MSNYARLLASKAGDEAPPSQGLKVPLYTAAPAVKSEKLMNIRNVLASRSLKGLSPADVPKAVVTAVSIGDSFSGMPAVAAAAPPQKEVVQAVRDQVKTQVIELPFNFSVTPESVLAENPNGILSMTFANKRLQRTNIDPQLAALFENQLIVPVSASVDFSCSSAHNLRMSLPFKAQPGERSDRSGNLATSVYHSELMQGVRSRTLMNRNVSDQTLLSLYTWGAFAGSNLRQTMQLMSHPRGDKYYYMYKSHPVATLYDAEMDPLTGERANQSLVADSNGFVSMPLEVGDRYYAVANEKLQQTIPSFDLNNFSVDLQPLDHTNEKGEVISGSYGNAVSIYGAAAAHKANWQKTPINFVGALRLEYLALVRQLDQPSV